LAETVSTNLSNAVTQLLKAFGYRRPYRYANNDPTSTGEMSRPPEKPKERAYPDLPPVTIRSRVDPTEKLVAKQPLNRFDRWLAGLCLLPS